MCTHRFFLNVILCKILCTLYKQINVPDVYAYWECGIALLHPINLSCHQTRYIGKLQPYNKFSINLVAWHIMARSVPRTFTRGERTFAGKGCHFPDNFAAQKKN